MLALEDVKLLTAHPFLIAYFSGELMGKLINIIGQRFGFWVVKERSSNNDSGQVQWMCICECGKERCVTSNSLRSGNSTSCGCNHTPDLSGLVFGDLTVLKIDDSKKTNSHRYWLCSCKCSNIATFSTYQLRVKNASSCGCVIPEKLNKKLLSNALSIDFLKEIQKSLFILTNIISMLMITKR